MSECRQTSKLRALLSLPRPQTACPSLYLPNTREQDPEIHELLVVNHQLLAKGGLVPGTLMSHFILEHDICYVKSITSTEVQ